MANVSQKSVDATSNNEQQNQQQNQSAGPQALAGSTQNSVASPNSRVASYSSGQQTGQGSGRFTNLKTYMNANQNATQNLESKANQNLNQAFNKQQQDVNQKNTNIQSAFDQGRKVIQQGQGFQANLNDINKGLSTGFTDFGNRQGFDTAGQQAITLAQNQNFQNVASGNAFDQDAVAKQQQAAMQAAQGLQGITAQNLQNIQTESGRDKLFSEVLQPKVGYNQGQKSFDQLFLQGALGGIRQNLANKNIDAAKLAATTGSQAGILSDLSRQEAGILSGLSDITMKNQQEFEKQFGNQKNIDYINKLRDERYNNLINNLKSGGTISKEDADLLGLDTNANFKSTYQYSNIPKSDSTTIKVQPVSDVSALASPTVESLNILNTLKNNNVNNYLKQGQRASSLQDITTQSDLDAYRALQSLAGDKTTGMLGGTSQLGSSISATEGKKLTDLGTDIASANSQFQKDLASNKFQGNTGNQFGGSYVSYGFMDSDKALAAANALMNTNSVDLNTLKNMTGDYRNPINYRFATSSGAAANDLASKILPYILDNQVSGFNLEGNQHNYNRALALNKAVNNLDQAGAFEKLNIVNNSQTPTRFKGLV